MDNVFTTNDLDSLKEKILEYGTAMFLVGVHNKYTDPENCVDYFHDCVATRDDLFEYLDNLFYKLEN